MRKNETNNANKRMSLKQKKSLNKYILSSDIEGGRGLMGGSTIDTREGGGGLDTVNGSLSRIGSDSKFL